MKVIDNKIGENGLSRILVNNGFGDLKVKVGDIEISCIRSILMNGNDTIRKLLLDDKCGEVLELYEKCEINSFLEIEKYYSGGIMELNENNVIDILRFSIYYNDNRIMRICKRYLKKHLNDSIMIEIFSLLNGLNMKKLKELRDMSEEYLKLNGYKYLNDERLLLKLNMDGVKMILNNGMLLINDENWLLNRLLFWYKNVLSEESEENEEEVKEFKYLIKTRIHLNEIKVSELSKEEMKELSELDINIEDYDSIHINLKMREMKNDLLMKIINEYYVDEEKDIYLNENEKSMLKEMKEEMIKLLSNDNMKLVEIILNILMEMKMSEIIAKEMKNRLLRDLLSEYGRNKRTRTLKCLSLFVGDKKNIITIENLCGKEVLYRILNEEYSLNSNSKELLIKYIKEMKLNEKEEEEMSKIIMNKELLSELLIKEVFSFSYPESEYVFCLNEEISIIPSFDGERCEFSITPSLPSGMNIDKENGIIHGKVDRIIEKKEYEVSCKNVRNEKKFKISLEFDVKFSELNKCDEISITNNGKTITNINNYWNHCYLNLRMENGIYHIKYQFHLNGSGSDYIMLGLSTNNTYSGNSIYEQSAVCNYFGREGKSYYITPYCHIGTVVNENPNFNNHGDGSIYEIIVDMNKREFWICHNNSSPILLVKDLPSPLYPYAAFGNSPNKSIELLSVSRQY